MYPLEGHPKLLGLGFFFFPFGPQERVLVCAKSVGTSRLCGGSVLCPKSHDSHSESSFDTWEKMVQYCARSFTRCAGPVGAQQVQEPFKCPKESKLRSRFGVRKGPVRVGLVDIASVSNEVRKERRRIRSQREDSGAPQVAGERTWSGTELEP